MSRILLLGRNGQLGQSLHRVLGAGHEVTALGRAQADLANPESLRAVVSEAAPDIIVNAAAYTAVDQAEREPELAQRINALAPGVLAEEACRLNAWLIHYSTDYVFDGSKSDPYTETDTPQPLNVYGRSKLAGERAIAQTGCKHLILRTSWVYSAHGQNFLKTIFKRAQELPELRVVDDQFGAPTSTELLASVTSTLIGQLDAHPDRGGIYHLTARGKTSWHDYAATILAAMAQPNPSNGLANSLAKLSAVGSDFYQTAATRPKNSLLSTEKIRRDFGLDLPDWQIGVEECLGALLRH